MALLDHIQYRSDFSLHTHSLSHMQYTLHNIYINTLIISFIIYSPRSNSNIHIIFIMIKSAIVNMRGGGVYQGVLALDFRFFRGQILDFLGAKF